MGLRFDIQSANWIASIIDADTAVPNMDSPETEYQTFHQFLEKLVQRYFSSPPRVELFRNRIQDILSQLDHHKAQEGLPYELLRELREHFRHRAWTALIIPSGNDPRIDKHLCSEELLRKLLLEEHSAQAGLILQLEVPPQNTFSLMDVFPAFRHALNESTHWPGVLIWTSRGDTAFVPISANSISALNADLHTIISELGRRVDIDLEYFLIRQKRLFQTRKSPKSELNIVQLSDLHLGSREADQRIARVQQLVRNIISELGTESRIVPLVTGDLMDTPNKKCRDGVRTFIDYLSNLGTERPVIILGNHDVRKGGWLTNKYKAAFTLPIDANQVIWYEQNRVGLICFNSVRTGKLARGSIGNEQLLDIGNEIDRKKDWHEYKLIGALHHHPVPVEKPDWYAEPFYEKVLGNWFEKTDALEDAELFLNFVESRRMAALLHGHKHIPRISKTPSGLTPVFGCGSTVSKLVTQDGGLYMSINVITLNSSTGQLSGRLLAERIPGGGLTEYKHHELVHRTQLLPGIV